MNLNNEQELAVKHVLGPMMVLAGPGTGKTTVIINRIYNLIKNEEVADREILVITFTKNAATELKDRLKKMDIYGVNVGTFHSVYYKILRKYLNITNDNLLMEDVKYKLIENIIKKVSPSNYKDKDYLRGFMKELTLFNSGGYSLAYFNPIDFSKADFDDIYKMYLELKKQMNKYDFDDIIKECYNILKSGEYKFDFNHIMIDEFQDINKVQYDVIKLILNKNKNLFIVGDDDQSIYKFRGSKPEIFLNFPKEFEDTKSINLKENYRSNKNIVKYATNVIKENENRFEKDLVSNSKSELEPVIFVSDETHKEVRNVFKIIREKKFKLNETAIIYRTNTIASSYIDHLVDLNIPFNIMEDIPNIYDHFIFKDIYSYVKLASDKEDVAAFSEIINKPNRYVSRAVVNEVEVASGSVFRNIYRSNSLKEFQKKRISDFEDMLHGLKKMKPHDAIVYIRAKLEYDTYIKEYSEYKEMKPDDLYEILDQITENAKEYETFNEFLEHVTVFKRKLRERKIDKDGVSLLTAHKAKGLEFENVFIVSANEDIFPHEKSNDISEERRLFYVALTRAKENLFISYLKKKYDKDFEKSRFINEMKLETNYDIGDDIIHEKFGEGKILEINEETVTIKFSKMLLNRKVNLNYCIENGLIYRRW